MAILTESKELKFNQDCHDHPIYLTWLNGVGGYDYWLFSKQHTKKIKTKITNSYSINIDDLENSIGSVDITGKKAIPTIQIGALIEAADMDGIESLYTSSKVLMLTNPDTWEVEGAEWVRVIVKTGSLLVLNTKSERLTIKMNLDLPYINKQIE